MKKIILPALALCSVIMPVSAKYTPGSTQIMDNYLGKGYSLKNEWAAKPDGITSTTVRQGIGANDYFFLNDYVAGVVKVYNKDGFVKDITIPGKKAWVSNTTDNAGNVIIRCDDKAFGGDYPNFYNGKSGIAVINPETLELTKDFIPFAEIHINHSSGDRDDVRFDAMGHIYGDVLGERGDFFAPSTRFGARAEEFVFSEGACTEHNWFAVTIDSEFSTTAAKSNQTLGSAMQFSETELAMYSNPYLNVTSSEKGLGNGIALYQKGESQWEASGKYFITPQHSSIGGFYVFTLQNKQYIVYPAGGGTPTGDAYAISEVRFTESVKSTDTDTDVLVARQYAAMTQDSQAANTATIFYVNYNVEAVPGDDCSVYIYVYNGGTAMSKWKFTVPRAIGTGIDEISVENADAPVEYFNLQGVRVENPADGIFIRRQGSKATKVKL